MKDQTPVIAERMGARVIRQLPPRGHGPAMEVLMYEAAKQSDALIYLDCDFTYPPDVIPQIRRILEEGVDVVNAARTRERPDAMPLPNYLANKTFAYMAQATSGARAARFTQRHARVPVLGHSRFRFRRRRRCHPDRHPAVAGEVRLSRGRDPHRLPRASGFLQAPQDGRNGVDVHSLGQDGQSGPAQGRQIRRLGISRFRFQVTSMDLLGRLRRRGASQSEVVLGGLALFVVVGMVFIVCEPLRHELDKWGGHDWDATLAFRYFVVKCVRVYHQFPFWLPYAGGGYTAWGFVDSDTVIVSPWLPLYFLTDLRVAARLEVLGTALLGAIGTWLLAGRFTKSYAARAFACAVFAVNGRWALQATAGHIWHVYFAWMPWAIYFYDRSLGSSVAQARLRWKDAVLSGVFIALMVYNGAIYPLPHTLLVLAVYGSIWRSPIAR